MVWIWAILMSRRGPHTRVVMCPLLRWGKLFIVSVWVGSSGEIDTVVRLEAK